METKGMLLDAELRGRAKAAARALLELPVPRVRHVGWEAALCVPPYPHSISMDDLLCDFTEQDPVLWKAMRSTGLPLIRINSGTGRRITTPRQYWHIVQMLCGRYYDRVYA